MTTMRFAAEADSGGVIHLEIPVGATGKFDVEVVVSPLVEGLTTPVERGWPPGFFERFAGCIDDDTFVAPERRSSEARVDLD